MTVEVQRLHNNSFNGFMEYLECDSFYSSSVSELNEIDATDVSEHAARYETLHQKLQETLSGIDGL